MTEKILNALRSIDLLGSLSDPFLQQLAQFTLIRQIRAGETIFCQGEPSPYCFGIVSGQVTIQYVPREKNFPPKVLSVLGPKALFGEQAFFKDSPRTAMAFASQNGELVAIQGHRFREWLEKDKTGGMPFILDLLRTTLARLGQTSHELSLVYGVNRCLANKEPVQGIRETVSFLRASLQEADEVRLYQRNAYWDEFECLVAAPDPEVAAPVLSVQHPLVQKVLSAVTAIVSHDAQETQDNASVALLPFIDIDTPTTPLLGFLWVGNRSKQAAFSTKTLMLLSAVSVQITEALLRLKRHEDQEAQSRLRQNRQSFSL